MVRQRSSKYKVDASRLYNRLVGGRIAKSAKEHIVASLIVIHASSYHAGRYTLEDAKKQTSFFWNGGKDALTEVLTIILIGYMRQVYQVFLSDTSNPLKVIQIANKYDRAKKLETCMKKNSNFNNISSLIKEMRIRENQM